MTINLRFVTKTLTSTVKLRIKCLLTIRIKHKRVYSLSTINLYKVLYNKQLNYDNIV
jgi:hypothetical protein